MGGMERALGAQEAAGRPGVPGGAGINLRCVLFPRCRVRTALWGRGWSWGRARCRSLQSLLRAAKPRLSSAPGGTRSAPRAGCGPGREKISGCPFGTALGEGAPRQSRAFWLYPRLAALPALGLAWGSLTAASHHGALLWCERRDGDAASPLPPPAPTRSVPSICSAS